MFQPHSQDLFEFYCPFISLTSKYGNIRVRVSTYGFCGHTFQHSKASKTDGYHGEIATWEQSLPLVRKTVRTLQVEGTVKHIWEEEIA